MQVLEITAFIYHLIYECGLFKINTYRDLDCHGAKPVMYILYFAQMFLNDGSSCQGEKNYIEIYV